MPKILTLSDGRRWNGLAYVHDAPVAGCDCGSCVGWFDKPAIAPLQIPKSELPAASEAENA